MYKEHIKSNGNFNKGGDLSIHVITRKGQRIHCPCVYC